MYESTTYFVRSTPMQSFETHHGSGQSPPGRHPLSFGRQIMRTRKHSRSPIQSSKPTLSCAMGSGPQKRSTTVHDRAALRVHPDGTRVTARESRYATRDLRGNRTATNAGGAGNVKKRKRATTSDDGTEPQEEFDIETDEYQPPESQSSSADSLAGETEDESERGGRKHKRQRKDPRTIKRTQFYQDFDFTLGGERGVGAIPVSNDSLLPSSVSQWCCPAFSATQYSN